MIENSIKLWNHQEVSNPNLFLFIIPHYYRLCNGTRLVITKLSKKLIEAKIIIGSYIGDIVYIPRIVMTINDNKLPFTLKRNQFLINLCYAMTINKS